MTNPMFNPQPNYSGVTIQIANPAVNVGPTGQQRCSCFYPGQTYSTNPMIYGTNNSQYPSTNTSASIQQPLIGYTNNLPQQKDYENLEGTNNYQKGTGVNYINDLQNSQAAGAQQPVYGYYSPYPPQYYLNNYNYQTNPVGVQEGNVGNNTKTEATDSANTEKNNRTKDSQNSDKFNNNVNNNSFDNSVSKDDNNNESQNIKTVNEENREETSDYTSNDEKTSKTENLTSNNYKGEFSNNKPDSKTYKANLAEEDMTKSESIKEDLDARQAALEEEKKNAKQKNITALTDEYIKSLENYLNNPNDEIRLMASKEILTRLDEDKDRYDDAALNALLNKMLQDPSKLIRIAALSAFSSQLASGNEYTRILLQNIQQNPSADKEDVIQAADILLKMSAETEIKNIPNPTAAEERK